MCSGTSAHNCGPPPRARVGAGGEAEGVQSLWDWRADRIKSKSWGRMETVGVGYSWTHFRPGQCQEAPLLNEGEQGLGLEGQLQAGGWGAEQRVLLEKSWGNADSSPGPGMSMLREKEREHLEKTMERVPSHREGLRISHSKVRAWH